MMKTCILSIQRYENIKDLYEWIDYHINLGFDKIFIMDNNDEQDKLIINNNKVDIIPYYGQRNNHNDWVWQREAYNYGFDYIRNFSSYDWILIIDIDEFITFRSKYENINDFIEIECINKGLDNIEIKWELYNDNNIIDKNELYYGHVLDTFKNHIDINNITNWNNINKWYSMYAYTKFLGKFKPELYYKESSHFPAKDLYYKHIYNWNLCNENKCVIRHYKYKTLEDFIESKCKLRNYVTSVHGSTWKYTRTYFEDNSYSYAKLFKFVLFDFKYQLNMSKYDIEYLHELLNNLNNNGKINVFHIYSNPNSNIEHNDIYQNDDINEYPIYIGILDFDICDFTRFMYNYKLYDICDNFFEYLFLYYYGGSFYNKYDKIIKPFNIHFKSYIDYCRNYTYEQLEDLYNELNKDNFINMFLNIE